MLTAIWAGNPQITGIEINKVLVGILERRYRQVTRIADHPGVKLIHDEARSYLTRAPGRFDVLQMSLIDTWAATGAGAFTLSENGLYTREGWQVFLRALSPNGVFSVSRWYDPGSASETTRLLSLGVGSLLDFGISAPRRHLVLVTRERVATMMVSPSPFTDDDGRRLREVADARGFAIQVSPWNAGDDQMLTRIAAATSISELEDATKHPYLDLSPPTDRRPFFFNMLKPAALFRRDNSSSTGVVSGNLLATRTLIALCGIAGVLVVAIIGWPLAQAGRPAAPPGLFAPALAYFGIIGLAFMLIQIPFLQRFSVYLGHPTYTFSIILFLMILAAGLGSLSSERIDVANSRRLERLPIAIAAVVLVETLLLQTAIESTVGWGSGRPHVHRCGVCRPARIRARLLLSDRAAPGWPARTGADRMDVGSERRLRGHGLDRRGDGLDVAGDSGEPADRCRALPAPRVADAGAHAFRSSRQIPNPNFQLPTFLIRPSGHSASDVLWSETFRLEHGQITIRSS